MTASLRLDVSTDESADTKINRPTPRETAATVREQIQDRLGDVVEAVYLFGSVARGDETNASDVDLLVVIDDTAEFASVDDQLLDIAYDVTLEHGRRVEIHLLRNETFTTRKERDEPFVTTVITEGERSE